MTSIPPAFIKKKGYKKNSIKPLGSGTYGSVFKAEKSDGSIVAVKFQAEHTVNFMELDLMTKYIQINDEKFKHPNLIYTNDIDYLSPNYFTVELPLGEDFEKACKNASDEQKLMYIYDIACGLCFLHNHGYYHCDIKMENIVIINNKAVIIDFGLLGTETTQTCNTYTYRPPELFKSVQKREALLKADSWALGVLIYYIYNNDNYFNPNPLSEENVRKKVFEFEKNPSLKFGKVPPELHEIMTGLMHPKVNQRLSVCDVFNKEPFVSKNVFVRIGAKANPT